MLWAGISTLTKVTETITFKLVLLMANTFTVPHFCKVWSKFLHIAKKYKKEYNKAPVLIIDNANRLDEKPEEFISILQDCARNVTDSGIATVVFVWNQSRGLHHMMSTLIL